MTKSATMPICSIACAHDADKCAEKYYFSCETHGGFMFDPCSFSRNTKISVVSHAKCSLKHRSSGKCSKLNASRMTILSSSFWWKFPATRTKKFYAKSTWVWRLCCMEKKWNIHAGQLKIRPPQKMSRFRKPYQPYFFGAYSKFFWIIWEFFFYF